MEPQGRRRISPFRVTKRSTKLRRLSKTARLRVHVQTVGLNAETKKCRQRADGEECLLTLPFIGLFLLAELRTKFLESGLLALCGIQIDCEARIPRGGTQIALRRVLRLVQLLNCLAESLLPKRSFSFRGVHHRLA